MIATGGSAVYSERAMRHLAGARQVVYLKAGCDLLAARIDDYERRGIANPGGRVLRGDLPGAHAAVRAVADAVVAVDGLTHEEVARAVMAAIGVLRSRT